MSTRVRFWGAFGTILICSVPTAAEGQAPRLAARTSAGSIALVPVRGTVEGTDLVRTARHFLGVPYVLGGETPKSFDCSGFVKYVFAQHGIAMPRTARQQAGVGVTPYPGDLQPGDLLFFYGGQGAQHIAIYVGADTIIHASSSGREVRLDRLTGGRGRKTWFSNRLIAVRRLLPVEGYHLLPVTQPTMPAVQLERELVHSLAAVAMVFQ